MMMSNYLTVLVFGLFIENMYATSCGADNSSFISLPIRNITLASEVVKRGIALLVGSPPQNLAFLIDA